MKKPVVWVLGCQLSVLAPVSVGLWLREANLGESALLGGLLFVLPNLYFTVYAFRNAGARSALQAAQAFYRGWIGKFVLTAMGFAVVFRFVTPLHVPTLFFVFGLMTVVQWVAASQVSKRFHP